MLARRCIYFPNRRRAGVVILHLLLIPGTAFVTGGARIIQQDLHPHLTQLNHSLLTIGYVQRTFAIFPKLSDMHGKVS